MAHLSLLHELRDIEPHALRLQGLCKKAELLGPHFVVHIEHHALSEGGHIELVHLPATSFEARVQGEHPCIGTLGLAAATFWLPEAKPDAC